MASNDIHSRTLSLIEQLVASGQNEPAQAIGRITDVILRYRTSILVTMLAARTGSTVQSGPFRGMKYVTEGYGAPLLPRLLGCYEAELHDAIEHAVKNHYTRIINIGCGEGYYAVGMARRMLQARVFAFDMSEVAQKLCRKLASLNGVDDRVDVGGECGIAELQRLAGRGTLILSDCEGAEAVLLDPDKVPAISDCDLIVELHDVYDRTISERVCSRFRSTHDITVLTHRGRDWTSFPGISGWKQYNQLLAMWEGRSGSTPWAVMWRR
jgi:hypothetical protein